MPTVNLGPWPKGIDNISEPSALAEGACIDAINGIIRRGGHFERRFNETLLNASSGHSPWKAPSGESYAVVDGILSRLSWMGGLGITPLLTMPTGDRVSFTTVNDTVLFASQAILGSINANLVTLLGVEMPGAFSAVPWGAGGLDAGRYGVAISYLAGTEEGGLSDVQFLDVAAGGGIQFSLPTPIEARVTGIRVYRTTWNGDVLYRAIDIPVLPTVLIGTDTITQQATTQFKTRMIGGDFLREWSARLVVGRGRNLYFSDPMNYGLRDARHGFIQMPERITFVEPLETGLYVGTTKKVYWLAGTTPKELVMKIVEMTPPVAEASMIVDDGPEGVEDYAAVWLGAGGYCFGLPSGRVLRPVSTVFELATLGTTGKLALINGALTTVMQ